MEREIQIRCIHCDNRWRTVSTQDRVKCPECEGWVPIHRGVIADMRSSKYTRELAEGPIPLKRSHIPDRLRMYVEFLKRPDSTPGSSKFRGARKSGAKTIAYLPGDERRAVTLFIEENEDYIRSCFEDKNNPLVSNWQDYLYDMLIEQWFWLGYADEQ